ncbi:hypothetical protein AAG906_023207 [Vitis piasezkii]
MQIKDYLYGRKLHRLFWGQNREYEGEEWTLLDKQVLGVIRLTLSRFVAHNVVKRRPRRSIKALSGMYEKSRFEEMHVKPRDPVRLNLETRGRGNDRNSNQGRSKSRNYNRNRSKSRSGQQVQCWNYEKTVDSPLDDWVLDSGVSFHTTPHQEIIQNYVADVRISLPNGSICSWRRFNIFDLRRNLISIGQLDDEGHAILFVGGTWKVTKGARVLARGKKTGTLYMTSSPRDTIAVVDASTDTSLWHRRLGHMSEKGMKMLLSKGKLPELKSIDFDMCESCILGKQKNVSFLKTGRTPKAEKLELVHTDLWGPSPVSSLGGSRYYITFIDDSSRKVWVYFLKNKSDVFETFKKWKVMNGVVERMNRTLNERARIPMEFKHPEEIWSGKEMKFSHLKSKICFFIGYGDEKFGYRGEEDKECNFTVDMSTLIVEVRRSSEH